MAATSARSQYYSCILLCLKLAFICQVTVLSLHIEQSFRDPDASQFQSYILHKDTGDLYIGGTNKLLQLSPSLALLESAKTGPRADNPDCPPPILPCDHQDVQFTDSYAKGLAIDYHTNNLIACFTLFHGFCQRRSLWDIQNITREIMKPLVPNQEKLSSVMFITDGPLSTPALYIGATYSNLGAKNYRDLVPSISSRDSSTFKYSYRDSKGGTKINILNEFRTKFPVKFVDGFSSGRFVYFITNQKKSVNSQQYWTKLIRICENDKYYQSYVEIPLQCRGKAGIFNMATGSSFQESTQKLYVTFSKAKSNSPELDPSISTLCIFDMDELNGAVNRTVNNCHQGHGQIGPRHIVKAQQCPKTSLPTDMCGTEIYPSIDGKDVWFQSPVLEQSQTIITAVTAINVNQYEIVFLGTNHGIIEQVVLDKQKGHIVDEIELDAGKPINKKLFFSLDQKYLYAMTESKVVKIAINDCATRKTCQNCVSRPNPLCGWCVMENKCSSKSECKSTAVIPSWMPAVGQTCAKISNVQPDILSLDTLDSNKNQITFTLEEITIHKDVQDNLQCKFVSDTMQHETTASVTDRLVACPLPGKQSLPNIPKGKDHQKMELQFRVNGRSLFTRSVSVYDCGVHSRCTECSNSKFGCKWCYNSNKCMKSSIQFCPDSGSSTQNTGVVSSDSCPRIESPDSDTDIRVHSGESKQIAVRVVSLMPEQKKNIICQFSYLGKVEPVPATLTNSNLVCSPIKFVFDDEQPYVTASFSVLWGDDKLPLDNPKDIQVRIYKCPLMVTNCGKCLSMDQDYECGWCQNRCTLARHCAEKWLDRSSTCPDPQILRFNPASGPVLGKTNISVTGINLGKSHTDVAHGVTVAGIKCHVHTEHYEPSSRFICETESTGNPASGYINVTVGGKYHAMSDSIFKFVEPKLQGLMPRRGPKSGGTVIIISGEHLNAGSETKVSVGRSPCIIIKQNSTGLSCRTTEFIGGSDVVDVEVSFGGDVKVLDDQFQFLDDPVINMIEPKRSIVSGGTILTVTGERLDIIQQPDFFIEYKDREIYSTCRLGFGDNKFLWLCPTPPYPVHNAIITETNPQEVHYGFILDTVPTLANLSRHDGLGPLLYYPDPEIKYFLDEPVKKEEKLVIKGKFRSINPLIQFIKIFVGGEECINPESTDTALSCILPPSPAEVDNEGRAIVSLQIGNFQSNVGLVEYYGVENKPKPIAMGIILGVVLPIIAIIALLAVCVWRRHRKHKPSDNYIPDVLREYEGKKEEEEIGMNHVGKDVADTAPFVIDYIAGIEDEPLREAFKSFVVPRSSIEIGDICRKDYYGAEYKVLYTKTDEQPPYAATVKTLQGNTSEKENLELFLQRMVSMKDFQHPNILPIFGVCISSNIDPMVVYPEVNGPDLKTYVMDSEKNLTLVNLLEFAQQIAEGMAYLHEHNVVNRDLAARNCLVEDDRIIKITGYGMTEDLFSKEYFTCEESPAKSAMKWFAPECLETFEFKFESDVWSFGIVLWELLTRGVTPYPDVEIASLSEYLKGGNRMKKPRQCPENIYELMLRCWSEDSSDRPTFRAISDELKTLTANGTPMGDETQPLNAKVEMGGSSEYLEVIG